MLAGFLRSDPLLILAVVPTRRRLARSPYASGTVERPPLFQFVVLSMLLHLLLIVLIGDSVRGSARRGEGFWGSLDVTLRRLSPAPGAREVDRPVSPATVPPSVIERRARPAPEPALQLAPIPLPPLERIVPQTIERELAPSVKLAPREALAAPAPLERIPPREIEQTLTPPIELHPRELPMTPPPIERIAPARIERELVPPVELGVRETPLVLAPIERLAPSQSLREMVVPTAASPRMAEPAIATERSNAPARESESAPATQAPAGAADAQIPSSVETPSAEPAPRLRFGAPQNDDDIFRPRRDVVVPSNDPGVAPHIDRDAARARAREIAREGSSSRALVQIEFSALERPRKNLFDKAAKPDCRTAYAGLGLLAIPVLLASALADTGCRW